MAIDSGLGQVMGRMAPSRSLMVLGPSNSTDLSGYGIKAIYVGVGGDIEIIALDNLTSVTLAAVPTGTLLPVQPRFIRTGTTASGLVGFC